MGHKYKRINNMNRSYKTPLYVKVILFALFLGVFAIYHHVSALSLEESYFYGPIKEHHDFFLYGKEVFYYALSIICLPYVIWRSFVQKNRFVVFSLVFVVLAAVSTIVSNYSKYALWGAPDNYQGFYSILSYGIIFSFGLVVTEDFNLNKYISNVVMTISGLLFALSLIEILYKPLLQISFIKSLFGIDIDLISHGLGLSLTFYNPDYLAAFITLLLPIIIFSLMSSDQIRMKVISLVVLCGMLIALVMTKSTAGFIVGFLELVALCSIVIVKKKPAVNVIVLVVACVLFVVGSAITGSVLNNDSYKPSKAYPVTHIDIVDDALVFGSDYSEYHIEFQTDTTLRATINDEYTLDKDNTAITIHDAETDSDINISVLGIVLELDLGYKEPIRFNYNNGEVSYLAQNTKILHEMYPSRYNNSGISSLYSFATGRGYIWVNTLPVVARSGLVGHGPGSFAFEFNQYDVPGMLRTHGTTNLIVDKPHNLYLQIATTIGVPALLVLIASYIGYLYLLIKQIVGHRLELFDACISLGILGFMLVSVVNDSMITVTPVFSLLFGFSLGRLACKKS